MSAFCWENRWFDHGSKIRKVLPISCDGTSSKFSSYCSRQRDKDNMTGTEGLFCFRGTQRWGVIINITRDTWMETRVTGHWGGKTSLFAEKFQKISHHVKIWSLCSWELLWKIILQRTALLFSLFLFFFPRESSICPKCKYRLWVPWIEVKTNLTFIIR